MGPGSAVMAGACATLLLGGTCCIRLFLAISCNKIKSAAGTRDPSCMSLPVRHDLVIAASANKVEAVVVQTVSSQIITVCNDCNALTSPMPPKLPTFLINQVLLSSLFGIVSKGCLSKSISEL